MKISKEQKEQNRRALLRAAVELMAKEGLKEVTLRRVAQSAGLSEPVIYKYFPSKDDLIAAYFLDVIEGAFAKVEDETDFARSGLTGQIHLLVDAILARYEAHRPFVSEAYQSLFLSSLSGSLSALAEAKSLFLGKMDLWLTAAVAAGEFGEPPSRVLVAELIWDFHLGLIYYWIKDDSPGSMRTLQLLDRSLAILQELLKTNIMARLSDLFFFLFREHFMKSIDRYIHLTDHQVRIKARFLGRPDVGGKQENGNTHDGKKGKGRRAAKN